MRHVDGVGERVIVVATHRAAATGRCCPSGSPSTSSGNSLHERETGTRPQESLVVKGRGMRRHHIAANPLTLNGRLANIKDPCVVLVDEVWSLFTTNSDDQIAYSGNCWAHAVDQWCVLRGLPVVARQDPGL